MRPWLIAVIAACIAFAAGLLIAPTIFYDHFIWKYIWGPIVADAAGHPVSYHGVRAAEGYTLVSEFIYGMLLLVIVYLMYRFFDYFNIKIDVPFFIASLPFIILGSTLRVLEDSGLFEKPLSYFFISPIIYIQVGIYFFLSLLAGIYIERSDKKIKLFVFSILAIDAAYAIMYVIFADKCNHPVHPLLVGLFSIVSLAIFFYLDRKNISTTMFSLGLLFLLPSLYLISIWIYGDRWNTFDHVNVVILPLVLIISSAVTLLVFILAKMSESKIFSSGINLSLIFAHMIDGWTSYFAVVNPLGMDISYGEKHPIPLFLMGHFYGLAYPLAKLAIIAGVIYAMDSYLKNELKEKPILAGLIKFFILVLGLAPGLRDMLRILMGI